MQPHPAPQALALIDHIQARYHEGHRLALAEIHTRAAALQAGGLATGVAQELRALGYALEQHMFKEEMRLFPMMEQGGNTLIAQLIEDLQREHVAHDAALQRLRARLQQLGDAQPPDPGLQPLQRAVDALAAELVLHMHAEDDELFPLFLPPSPTSP